MTALIEHKSGYRLDREESLVAAALKDKGQAFEIAALSQVQRGRVDATKASLVVGSLDFMSAALKQRDIVLPVIDSYPGELAGLLRRRVWRSTLCHVLEHVERTHEAVFVKPAVRAKRFTGFVLDDDRDWRLHGVSNREPVWCSEPVAWVSEWRVYVVRKAVRFIAHYEGDQSKRVERNLIEMAVRQLAAVPVAPRSYAIDFGVLASGETALVEMNDGLAIGAYDGIDSETYLAMLQDRWDQLTAV